MAQKFASRPFGFDPSGRTLHAQHCACRRSFILTLGNMQQSTIAYLEHALALWAPIVTPQAILIHPPLPPRDPIGRCMQHTIRYRLLDFVYHVVKKSTDEILSSTAIKVSPGCTDFCKLNFTYPLCVLHRMQIFSVPTD